jgi:hypothetical protein
MSEPKKACPLIEGYKLSDPLPDWTAQALQRGYNITATQINEQISDLMESMRPGMHKSHYKAFAKACHEIEQGIIDLHIPMPEHYRDQVMELVVARIALVCAKDNDKFDSFQFAEAAGKNARRAIGVKSGSAARSSTRALKGSKP